MLNLTVEDMASQPMVLKLKPVQTKKIVAAPSPVTFEPVSKRTSTKYDDNKIAERIPIEELKSGKYELPIWAEGLFDATPEGMPRRRRRLGHLSNDQKMLRRKLKNRVAAQNARDKKKTESENLKLENEKLLRLVHKLQTENLQRENELKSMAEENQDLRQRLGLDERTYRTFSEADSGCEESSLDRSSSSSPGVFCVTVSSASSPIPNAGSPHVLKIEPVNSGSPPAVSEDPNSNYQSYGQGFVQETTIGGTADGNSPACEQWFDDNRTNNQCEQNYFHEDEPIRVHSPQNNVRCTSTPNTNATYNQYEQLTNEQTNAVDQLIDDFTMGGGEALESDLDQLYSQEDFDSLFSLTV